MAIALFIFDTITRRVNSKPKGFLKPLGLDITAVRSLQLRTSTTPPSRKFQKPFGSITS